MGSETSLEFQGRRTRGQQWDTYQVPGPAWGMDWDIKTRKTRSLSSRRNQSVCVCVCVCEVCIHVLCVCLCVCEIHVLCVCLCIVPVCVCVKCGIHVLFVCVSVYCVCVCVCDVRMLRIWLLVLWLGRVSDILIGRDQRCWNIPPNENSVSSKYL